MKKSQLISLIQEQMIKDNSSLSEAMWNEGKGDTLYFVRLDGEIFGEGQHQEKTGYHHLNDLSQKELELILNNLETTHALSATSYSLEWADGQKSIQKMKM